ncbi:hypothetical protein MYAM1_002935 [Malassezia yamatoensis]|uniref:Pinin/SDK/MemA protein domain-containing protein n=1 Tax=Malassezia yamatoensis TaxID=253288 RepID=A0AAJ5YUU8_9BASI|nr:hypothetical protein MYAM1_002935 [Malassezia yamatoensis]
MTSEELRKEGSQVDSNGTELGVDSGISMQEAHEKHSAGNESENPAPSVNGETQMGSNPIEADSSGPNLSDGDGSEETRAENHRLSNLSPSARRSGSSSPQRASKQDPSSNARVQSQEKQRGKRLLGLLNHTLAQPRDLRKRLRTQAPSSSSNHSQQEAPAADLEAERATHNAERAAIRTDLERIRQLAEQLAACESAYRTARSQKRRLSSYLVTHVASKPTERQPAEPMEAAVTSLGRGSDVPIVVEGTKAYDVYYLPRKLLPSQEDTLDAQEEAADDAIDRADDEYDQQRAKMEQELFECKSRLQQQHIDPNTWPRRKAW